MTVPHFGHLRSTQGTPRSCGSFSPHFGHRQVPISPAARGPPMRPRPCPPRPWPCPPPFPVPPRPFSSISYSSLFMPFIFWPRRRPRPQQPGMAKPSHSKLPLSQARMASYRPPAANGPSEFRKRRPARASAWKSRRKPLVLLCYLEFPSSGGIAAAGLSRNSRDTTYLLRVTLYRCPGAPTRPSRQLWSPCVLLIPEPSFFKPSPIAFSPLATILYRKALYKKAGSEAHICGAYRRSHYRFFSSVESALWGDRFSAVRYEVTFL